MSDDRADLILTMLRAIRAKQDEHTAALRELRELVGFLAERCSFDSRGTDRATTAAEHDHWHPNSATAPDV